MIDGDRTNIWRFITGTQLAKNKTKMLFSLHASRIIHFIYYLRKQSLMQISHSVLYIDVVFSQ